VGEVIPFEVLRATGIKAKGVKRSLIKLETDLGENFPLKQEKWQDRPTDAVVSTGTPWS
jgi:hypothetical protein